MLGTLLGLASLPALLAFGNRPEASCHGRASTSGTSWLDFLIREPGVAFTGGISYGELTRQKLDLYTPCARPDGPVILFLYGGAWTSGERRSYEFVGTALAARGITTAIPDYRLYPEVRFPGFVEDAARAYGFLARRFPGRPIYLMGHSAGAYNAALLALDARYRRQLAPGAPAPAGFIGLAGPYAFDPTTWPGTAAIFTAAAGQPDEARPVAFAGEAPLPALLLHGKKDQTVEPYNTDDLAKALDAAGSQVEEHIYPGLGHVGLVAALAWPLRWRADVLDRVAAFVTGPHIRATPVSAALQR
jgi:acetyl esterase/lipase